MRSLERITRHSQVMNGKACVRGMRVTVGMVVRQVAAGCSLEKVLAEYSYLEAEDVRQAFRYARLLAEER